MAAINVRRLEFARAAWDTLVTSGVVLDPDGPTYAITMHWRPKAATWVLSMRQATGAWVVRGVAVRDRTDCLLGISAPGRPRGAIIAYDPKGRGDPGLTSFSAQDVRLYYLPDGFNPEDFSRYTSQVA